MSLLITPMWTSGKPPWSCCNAVIIFGKFVASAVCLGSIEGELSTTNKMSTERSGLTVVPPAPPDALVVPATGLVVPPVAPVPPPGLELLVPANGSDMHAADNPASRSAAKQP